MKKILFYLVVLVIALASSGCSSENKYKKHIEELNQQLPQGNGSIRLDKMLLEDGAFKCYYTILIDVLPPAEEELIDAKKMLIERVKGDSSFDVFREDKLDFYFVYRKDDGTKMWEVRITPEDYL